MTFEQPGPNLERAGQCLHGHSLFIAQLFARFVELVSERAIELELQILLRALGCFSMCGLSKKVIRP